MDFDGILQHIIRNSTVNLRSIHGPGHWARVERNGLFLAPSVGADEQVVSLFAYFHDCRRLNDGYDPRHGPRAARYVESVRDLLAGLDRTRLATLVEACEGHTRRRTTDDPTIGVCWDADRLDLPRVGIRPRVKYFHTETARDMVAARDLSPLEALEPRTIPSCR